LKEYSKGVKELWGKGYALRDLYGLGTGESDVFIVLNILIQWYHDSIGSSEGKLIELSEYQVYVYLL